MFVRNTLPRLLRRDLSKLCNGRNVFSKISNGENRFFRYKTTVTRLSLKKDVDNQIKKQSWATIPLNKLTKFKGSETTANFRKKIETYFLDIPTRIRNDGTRSFELVFTVVLNEDSVNVYLENKKNENKIDIFNNKYFQHTVCERLRLLADMRVSSADQVRIMRFKQIFVLYPKPIKVPPHIDDFAKHCVYEISGNANSELRVGTLRENAFTAEFIIDRKYIMDLKSIPSSNLSVLTPESPHMVSIVDSPRIVSVLGKIYQEKDCPTLTTKEFLSTTFINLEESNPCFRL